MSQFLTVCGHLPYTAHVNSIVSSFTGMVTTFVAADWSNLTKSQACWRVAQGVGLGARSAIELATVVYLVYTVYSMWCRHQSEPVAPPAETSKEQQLNVITKEQISSVIAEVLTPLLKSVTENISTLGNTIAEQTKIIIEKLSSSKMYKNLNEMNSVVEDKNVRKTPQSTTITTTTTAFMSSNTAVTALFEGIVVDVPSPQSLNKGQKGDISHCLSSSSSSESGDNQKSGITPPPNSEITGAEIT